MNEPPPPYEVKQGFWNTWWLWCDGSPLHDFEDQNQALKWRDRLNSAYTQGRRDRDEQAKLACSESSDIVNDSGGNGTSEDEQWEELADMLGFESVHYMLGWMEGANGKAGAPMPGLCDERQIVRAFKAMLIGLAEDECNGSVWHRRDAYKVDSGNWCWSAGDDDYECGSSSSRPAAAISMLLAYRECDDAK
jgi:hypothetical protein